MGGLLDRANVYRGKNAPAAGQAGRRSLLTRAFAYRGGGMSAPETKRRAGRSLLARAIALRTGSAQEKARRERALLLRLRPPEWYTAPVIPGKRRLSGTLFGYVFSEIIIYFLMAFFFFFGIFFVNQLLLIAREIMAKQVPLHEVALLILYALPSIVAMAAPFGSLVGTLMAIGRLSSDNEILVMLSSGLSYRTIFAPAIAAGILVSMVSFVANDILLPLGTVHYARLYRRILFSTPALELEANSVKRFRDTIIITGNVTGRTIDDMVILDKTSDGERRLILAKRAELVDAGRAGLSLDLYGAFVQSSREIARQDYDYATASFLRYFVPQEDIIQNVAAISPREMSSLDVWKEIRVKEANLAEQLTRQKMRILNGAMHVENALRGGPEARASWRDLSTHTAQLARDIVVESVYRRDRNLSLWRLEFYKKFSLPFAALSFVLLAVSVGLLAKKNGQILGMLIGSIIAAMYWAMLLGGQTIGMVRGFSPFFSMWLPNMLCLGAGIIMLFARVRR